jgi:hypothetical protein
MVVQAEEGRTGKLVGGEGMAEMRRNTVTERTAKMAREAESQFHMPVLNFCD